MVGGTSQTELGFWRAMRLKSVGLARLEAVGCQFFGRGRKAGRPRLFSKLPSRSTHQDAPGDRSHAHGRHRLTLLLSPPCSCVGPLSRQSRHRLRLLPTEVADSPTGSPTGLSESVWGLLGRNTFGCHRLVPWHTAAHSRPFKRPLSMCSTLGPWGGSPNSPSALGAWPREQPWVVACLCGPPPPS